MLRWNSDALTHRLSLALLAFVLSASMHGQTDTLLETQSGSILGTVSDVNGDTVASAAVVLQGRDPTDRRTATTNDNGFFEFRDLRAGTPYQVAIRGEGFAEWTSPDVTIEPNQSKILTGIRLRVATVRTAIVVTQTQEEIAAEQVKAQEKQRIFGIIPNFYVVYGPNAVPLTAKLKFQLAAKVAIDPVTILGMAFISGLQQAGDTPNYGQGAQGFAKRFAANTTDGLTSIMIGSAILPSLLHQDPRYFFQGRGTTQSRLRHALSSPFVCKGDNGKWQPNYSSLGGDLASAAISNTYYPESNRGVGVLFTNFAMSTGGRAVAGLAQEFIVHKLTRRPGFSK